jgi:hypothetical protein
VTDRERHPDYQGHVHVGSSEGDFTWTLPRRSDSFDGIDFRSTDRNKEEVRCDTGSDACSCLSRLDW